MACRGDGVGALAVGEEAEEAAATLEGAEGSRVAGDGRDGTGDAALAGEARPGGFGGGGIGIGLGELVAQCLGGLIRLASALADRLAVAGEPGGETIGLPDRGIERLGPRGDLVEEIGAFARIYFGAGRGDGLVDGAGLRRWSIESTFWPRRFAQSST